MSIIFKVGVWPSKFFHPAFSICFACLFFLTACQTGNLHKESKEEPTSNTLTASSPVYNPSRSISLDGNWRFSIDRQDIGESESWFAPNFDDSAWQIVSVPHTWNVMPEYSIYNGLAWYRYETTLPREFQGMLLRICFQAVYYLARIWINGDYVGEHEGGYTPFEFDVSSFLKPGLRNIVAVQVDNKISPARIPAQLSGSWSFDWWNYGGIVRSVSIEATNLIYISGQRIVARPELTGIDEAKEADISSTVTIENTSENRFDGQIFFTIYQEESNQIVFNSREGDPVSIAPGQSAEIQFSSKIENPKLWHFDHPNLYVLAITLKKNGQDVHHLESIFGIRQIELKNNQIWLNGEPVRLVGVTRHADSLQFGLAETVQIMAADYNDIKTLNEVFSRPVHYPQAEYILDYADRHGILFIPEVPAWQLTARQMDLPKMQELEKQQLFEMITSEYNHPSIWAWSIGNEIESETPEGHAFVKQMIDYVKSLDPTRPAGFASNRLNSNPGLDATALSDFVMMNQYWGGWAGPKQGLPGALDAIHAIWPDKTVIISEFGFEPNWNRFWGPATSTLNYDDYYFIPDGTPPDSDLADEQRQLLIHDQMEVFRTKPFIAGAIFWTYQDYRTRSNFVMGVVDGERNKRVSWQFLREEYAPALLDTLDLFLGEGNQYHAITTLHTRGPIEADMPAYTLRDYTLAWKVTSLDKVKVFSEGDILLPELTPASEWSGAFDFSVPNEEYIITLSIVRPTGFSVIDRSYNSQGVLIP
jgi:beta-galactosidase/beta-glucuronidase